METQWYYSRDGGKSGPVLGPELKRLAGAGELAPTDLVCGECRPNCRGDSTAIARGKYSATSAILCAAICHSSQTRTASHAW